MKKIIICTLLALTMVFFAACRTEVIDDNQASNSGNTQTTAPTNPISKPIDKVDESDAEQSGQGQMTGPTENQQNEEESTDPTDSKEPAESEPTDAPSFITETLNTYPSNDTFDPDGKLIDESKNGSVTTYKVKYTKTLSLIVEVSQAKGANGTDVTVKTYLQHYSLFMNEGKKATVTIGDKSFSAISTKIEREDATTAARTLLVTAKNTVPSGEPFDLKFYMLYGGKYNGIDVEELSFEKTIMAQ